MEEISIRKIMWGVGLILCLLISILLIIIGAIIDNENMLGAGILSGVLNVAFSLHIFK